MKKTVFTIVAAGLLAACSPRHHGMEYDKPAAYWYNKISQSISKKDLDKADLYYTSLRSEHSHSPLSKTAIMLLANAHMANEEYRLASYYFDEYSRQFGNSKLAEYIDFMKLKASFMAISDPYKDQSRLDSSINATKTYLRRYPASQYEPLAKTLLTRMYMTQYLLNDNIAKLYERTGKAQAAAHYQQKNSHSPLKRSDITPPKSGFISDIFN